MPESEIFLIDPPNPPILRFVPAQIKMGCRRIRPARRDQADANVTP